MRKAFNGLMDRLNMTEERLFELEDMKIETSKPNVKRKKTEKNNRYLRTMEYKRYKITVIGIPEGEERGKEIK